MISLLFTSPLFLFWCKEFEIIILLIVYILGKPKHHIFQTLCVLTVDSEAKARGLWLVGHDVEDLTFVVVEVVRRGHLEHVAGGT